MKLIVKAVGLGAVLLVLLGCTPKEINTWGAQIRGAVVSSLGGTWYATGGATRDTQRNCQQVMVELEPWLNPDTAWRACGTNRIWEYGDAGFTRNILDP